MTRDYQVEAVAPRERISHKDFFQPRNRVNLVRVDDGEVLQVLLPIRRCPKPGDKILLNDQEIQALLADSETGPGIPPTLKN